MSSRILALVFALCVGAALCACRRQVEEESPAATQARSMRAKMVDESLTRIEQMVNRGQRIEATCAALRSQLGPLREKSDTASRAVLMRYHRICTVKRPDRP